MLVAIVLTNYYINLCFKKKKKNQWLIETNPLACINCETFIR
jgi:hypothetical protein